MPEVKSLNKRMLIDMIQWQFLPTRCGPYVHSMQFEKFKEFSREGKWTDWITGWINITTECSINNEIQVLVG